MFWWNKRTVRKEKGGEVKGEVERCVKRDGRSEARKKRWKAKCKKRIGDML